MKRKQSIVISMAMGLFIIMLFACNSNKEQSGNKYLNVKIKVGVVLKSGDVKNVARQDLIISKSNAVNLWETIKRNTIQSRKAIEEETKVELDYQTKLDAFQKNIANNEYILKQLRVALESKTYSIVKRLSRHMEITCREGMNHGVGYYFELFNPPSGPIETMFSDVESRYKEVLTYPIGSDDKKFVESRYAEFKGIRESFISTRPEIAAHQKELEINQKFRREFLDKFEEVINQKEEAEINKAKEDFLNSFRQEIYIITKTDLNGEAYPKLPEGNCFIFCWAEIGLNFIGWNYETKITKEGQYIELANDNAFTFSKEEILPLLEIICLPNPK